MNWDINIPKCRECNKPVIWQKDYDGLCEQCFNIMSQQDNIYNNIENKTLSINKLQDRISKKLIDNFMREDISDLANTFSFLSAIPIILNKVNTIQNN